ncbi:MAG: nucleotidyltransferase family protein [candidate division KSB1 bacterium]|nr:nucleotidyltransferase family protein [candidate division KSB1 bacterium]
MKAVVLVAGYATRLYPLTKDRPKSLLPIGNRTVLDFTFDRLATVEGLDTVFLVTNSRFYEPFARWWEERMGARPWPWRHLEIVDDGTWDNESRLGAIGDLQFALERYSIRDDLLVTAGDNIFPFAFSEPVRYFETVGFDVITVYELHDRERLRRTGVAQVDATGRVLSFQEKPAEPASNLATPPFYLLKAETLPYVARYLEEGNSRDAPGHLIAWLCARRPVYAWRFEGEVLDIGHLESYRRACQMLRGAAPFG